MPVSDEGAALQFFVEAMKANTAVLKGIQQEQRETLQLVHDTRERVIKIEAGGQRELLSTVRAESADLIKRVDQLEKDKDRREGASSFAVGAIKNGPAIVTVLSALIIVIIVLVANGKI